MKKMILFFILFVAACGTYKNIELSRQDTGKTIDLTVGDKVAINLEENPTTGYGWNFFIEPENQNVIANIHEDYKEFAHEPDMVGVGGIKTYRFDATEKGKVKVDGYYYRPWEQLDKQTAEHVNFEFVVE